MIFIYLESDRLFGGFTTDDLNLVGPHSLDSNASQTFSLSRNAFVWVKTSEGDKRLAKRKKNRHIHIVWLRQIVQYNWSGQTGELKNKHVCLKSDSDKRVSSEWKRLTCKTEGWRILASAPSSHWLLGRNKWYVYHGFMYKIVYFLPVRVGKSSAGPILIFIDSSNEK